MGGRTDTRTDGCTENIYSIFRDKLLLLGGLSEHQVLAEASSSGVMRLAMVIDDVLPSPTQINRLSVRPLSESLLLFCGKSPGPKRFGEISKKKLAKHVISMLSLSISFYLE